MPLNLEINQTFISPSEYLALYADARNFSTTITQRDLYFFFDPREGDHRLILDNGGIDVWDSLADDHTNSSEMNRYFFKILISQKNYPSEIIFSPPQQSRLQVSDSSKRVASRYFIQNGNEVPFILIDEVDDVDIYFLSTSLGGSTIQTILNRIDRTEIKISMPTRQQPDSLILLWPKSRLSITLSENDRIGFLALQARQIQVFHACGEANSLSRMRLECSVEIFTVTIIGDLAVDSCEDVTLS